MQSIKSLLIFADSSVSRITRYGVILSLIVLFVLLLARVISRATEIPFAIYDDIVELATIWLIILGAVAMWREGALYRVDVAINAIPGFGRFSAVVIQAIMLTFALVLVWFGGNFTAMSREVTTLMQIDKIYYYGAIPVAGVVMALYSIVSLCRALRCAWTGQPQRPPLDDHATVDHL